MQRDRRDEHAARGQPRQQLRGQRPSGARHLRRSGLGGERRQVRLERPRLAARSRSGSARRGGRGARRTARSPRSGRATAAPRRRRARRAPRRRRRPARCARRPAGRRPDRRRRECAARPPTSRRTGRRARASTRAAAAACRRRHGPRARRAAVAETLTTRRSPGREDVRQVAHLMVRDAAVGARRDHQAHLVAREPARLGRLGGLEPGGQIEGEGAHTRAPATSWARQRPLARSPVISASSPGTLCSGSGRSEMSSPGNASWCMRVRMSPGSTA